LRFDLHVVSIESGSGLSNATIQQRLVPVRLFYDFLMEEGVRVQPGGPGSYTSGRRLGGHERGLVPRLTRLPWIPGEQERLRVLEAVRREPARNRVMLAVAYEAALCREELCSLQADDLDPAHRTLRVRSETAKTLLERVVPYPASTGVLLSGYLARRAGISRAREPLFLSESRRNYAEPLSLWTWSKVVRRIALASGVDWFSTQFTRGTRPSRLAGSTTVHSTRCGRSRQPWWPCCAPISRRTAPPATDGCSAARGRPLQDSARQRHLAGRPRCRVHPRPAGVPAGPPPLRPTPRRGAAMPQLQGAATEVACLAGHSVAVLLKVSAHCIDGQDDGVNKRIAGAPAAKTAPVPDDLRRGTSSGSEMAKSLRVH
jgi:hypothetical protein